MMHIDRLILAIKKQGNPSALGLDTRYEYIPDVFAKKYATMSEAVFAYNAALLQGLAGIIPCVKIQAAYYELLGVEGMQCMAHTIKEAERLGFVTIIDAKRGDISATATAYAQAFLTNDAPFCGDFLTINPYLGSDGVLPFVDVCKKTGRGIFVLVKTSNPSSGEFQDLLVHDGKTLYEHVADKIAQWGAQSIGTQGYSSVAAVVGATYPAQGAQLRAQVPQTFFLVPGYGAQGASASDLAVCFDKEGSGAVVAASRSLICAHKKTGTDDFVGAAQEEALRMKKDITSALQ